MLGLANIVVSNQRRPIEGVNLNPLPRGQIDTPAQEALFWRKSRPENAKSFALRFGDWKLIRLGNNTPRLYNLDDDIGKTANLLEEHSEKAVGSAELWNDWNADNLAGTSTPCPPATSSNSRIGSSDRPEKECRPGGVTGSLRDRDP